VVLPQPLTPIIRMIMSRCYPIAAEDAIPQRGQIIRMHVAGC
jgi:hypothetical protein